MKGARQVGKTYIIEDFAKNNYQSYIYINFELMPEYKNIFDGNLDIKTLIMKLELTFPNISIIPNDTILLEILDIENELDRCTTLFCWVQRSQMFLDGNKRVANLVANKEMIRNGQGIIAVPVEKIGDYFVKLIKYYETNDMKDLKLWIYDNCIDGI